MAEMPLLPGMLAAIPYKPPVSPVLALHSAWFSHSLKKSDRPNFDFGHYEERLHDFIVELCDEPCRDLMNIKRGSGCLCLYNRWLGENVKASVVEALKNFALLKREEQNKRFIEWILYAAASCRAMVGMSRDARRKTFILPGSVGTMICKNAIATLLGYGKHSLKHVIYCAKNNVSPVHGLFRNSNAASKIDFDGMMKAFFEVLSEFSAPRATRIVATFVNGVVAEELRDEMVSELPPSFTKRRVYGRFLLEHGWSLKLDAKGKILTMSNGDVVVDGKTSKEMPSWRTFLRYWKANYPRIVIQRAREDICNECYVFSNEHRYRDQRQRLGLDSDGSLEGSGSENEARFDKMIAREQLINEAHKHVGMARAQREFFNLKKLEAKADVGKPRAEQCHTYVADYCQNMGIPHFGSEQPGETYYMSPLNVYTFGVVDCSTVPSHLAAYVYLEGEANKKGGNSVVSLIWAELDRKGLLPPHPMLKNGCDDWTPVKELNLFFDNCGGQNKNRMVLRLLPLLVGLRVAKTVRASFLVRGHTKNDCDRLFNLLKKEYRTSNVYIPDDLIATLNTCDDVTAIRVEQDMFMDFDSCQKKYFVQPADININHIFTVLDTDASTLLKKEFFGAVESSQRILLPIHEGTKWMNSHYNETELDEGPGMKDIKWVELYSKIGKYVPPEKKALWKYYNEDPGAVRKDKVKSQSKQSKKQRNERTVTVDPVARMPHTED
jgi:hypothetical protein